MGQSSLISCRLNLRLSNSFLILFLERKSIKKNFYFEPGPIAIPEFPPDNGVALLIEE